MNETTTDTGLQPTRADEYSNIVKGYQQNRETYMVTLSSGAVFEVRKIEILEVFEIFELLGIDMTNISTLDHRAMGIKLAQDIIKILDELLPRIVRTPKIVTSTHPEGNHIRTTDLDKGDQWDLLQMVLEGASGGGATKEAQAFLDASDRKDGSKDRPPSK